ncbi:mannose-6-phosphate isomerase, class I [Verruconis gallopava]|uniref:Mannose-6-phosphate isomerase n=1 Tax=Verruconis gallopava TaxID=253628 RepID=A0A0D2AH47_9PEZI|nr:mannose-6-phosphate isomerase, class I [Verruconis gallopava]KIW06243.1 mannose-6-phosphate isomerase, class I [Verruconis gallopava]
MVQSVLQLKCSCNNYPWGKQGWDSIAATLCSQTPGTDFKVDVNKTYSEMWMGTYPNLPSYVLESGESLQDVINAYPDQLLGNAVFQKFGLNLPFLPKILSIAKALPLQLHPNRTLASELHRRSPEQFTDPNHKPEIAIALGTFEAFVGWKPLEDVDELLQLEPLKQFMPPARKPAFDDQMLKGVCELMLKADEETVARVGQRLQELPKAMFKEKHRYIQEMIPRLWSQYDKTDNGILVSVILMNYMKLSAGEGIYIPADSIHAYLSGDIIECMASSNNVLSTGFCPRADRDNIDTFLETLSFITHSVDEARLEPQIFKRSRSGKTKVYEPTISEFSLLATELSSEESDFIEKLDGPSIMIVTRGRGIMKTGEYDYELKEGFVFCIGAGVATEYIAVSDLQLFRAYTE